METYQKHFSFRGVLFTKCQELADFAQSHGLLVYNDGKENEFSMPFVNDMLIKMKERVKSEYYGFINSDILLNPKVFQVLYLLRGKVECGIVKPNHSLLSQVIKLKVERNLVFQSIKTVTTYFYEQNYKTVRNKHCIVSNSPFRELFIGCFYLDLLVSL